MQNYIALRIEASPCNDTVTDLLAAFLGDIGYESFTSDESGITAYVQNHLYDPSLVDAVLSDFPIDSHFTCSSELIEGQDWNEEWEKNYFKPIIIGDQIVVHSTFHKEVPQANYDIVIDPKMAFGTGHHATTSQMMRHILEADLKGRQVIDMGTGTGILAILSKMRGASHVVGIEIDPFAWENAVENARLNNVEVDMICGDAGKLEGLPAADVFLANINRNIITADISRYASSVQPGGSLYLSGFYEKDIPIVVEAGAPYGFRLESTLVENDWAAIRLVKTN